MENYNLHFTVERIRPSVTQGTAQVYCNNILVAVFGDTIELIKPGQTYYGELLGSWASTVPDGSFIRAALFHEYDSLYHISDGVKTVLDGMAAEERKNAPHLEEIPGQG